MKRGPPIRTALLRVAIDPYHLLIDLKTGDNYKRVVAR
jgi:hypothetical protein